MGERPPKAAEEWVLPGYEHERVLGAGATGRVVLARHTETGTPVAIKYLIKSSAMLPAFAGGFENEARILSTLDSPNVTALYEYVEGPQGSAIVMELVEGATLRAVLRDEGATGPEAALSVLKGSLLGLAAAHEAGVVHRDYKPDNVLLTPSGTSKLVDFGLAAHFGTTPAAAGTPVYMAPERFKSGAATAASDVYAATATFFECITGNRPYTGATSLELMVQHTEAPIPDEQAPEPLRPLIRAGLAKAPEERPSSAAAFVAQLDEIAREAYGEDWEERGQRKLATILAALPLLLLRGEQGPGAEAATDFALTHLGTGPSSRSVLRQARGPVAATVGIVALALLISQTAKPTASVADGTTVQIATTFTANGPLPATGPGTTTAPATTASASAAPSGTATTPAGVATTSGTGPTSSTQTGGSSTTQPAGAATTTSAASAAPTTAPTTKTPTTPPPPPPVLTVNSVQITGFGCQARTGIYAIAEVKSDGKAAGTLTFTWFSSATAGGARTTYGTPTVVTLAKGQTDVKSTEMQDFSGTTSPYWGVEVTTSPAAGSGNGTSDSLFGTNCEIQ
ncbi:MAG TPA: serine/threonine-protein kinase [Actinospica sp.]|nr:serine/threonine-protein kinase [Actinospica sp.]